MIIGLLVLNCALRSVPVTTHWYVSHFCDSCTMKIFASSKQHFNIIEVGKKYCTIIRNIFRNVLCGLRGSYFLYLNLQKELWDVKEMLLSTRYNMRCQSASKHQWNWITFLMSGVSSATMETSLALSLCIVKAQAFLVILSQQSIRHFRIRIRMRVCERHIQVIWFWSMVSLKHNSIKTQ